MGSKRRARRQERARNFGQRHPRLSLVIVCALLAGVVLICGAQLSYGTYLGRGWLVAALAGMAAAAGLGAAALAGHRRHRPMAGGAVLAWVVLGAVSTSAIKFPFPRGPYGSGQAFFNVVHAALLGYEAVTCTAILALLARVALRRRGRARGPAVRPGHEPRHAVLPARLRFPAAEAATWRDGRLIAMNGTVTWQSLNRDIKVDLTSACQALPTWSADAHSRQPRTTTLATASGLAELDIGPRTLAELVRTSAPPPVR